MDLDSITIHQMVCWIFSPHLINYDFNATQRHYFLIAGAIFNINENIKLRPSSYVKVTQNAASTLDLSGLFIFQDRLWAGLAFRAPFGAIIPTASKGGGYALLAGVNLSDQLSVVIHLDTHWVIKLLSTTEEHMKFLFVMIIYIKKKSN